MLGTLLRALLIQWVRPVQRDEEVLRVRPRRGVGGMTVKAAVQTFAAACLFVAYGFAAAGQSGETARPLRVCIVGLVHGHVDGFLHSATKRRDVEIAGVYDPDEALRQMYAQRYGLVSNIFYADLATMLDLQLNALFF